MAPANNNGVCYICGKKFSQKSGIYKHIRLVHKVEPQVKTRSTIACPQESCGQVSHCLASFRHHLASCHEFSFVRKKFHFPSMSVFMIWKQAEEERTRSSFVRRHGATKQLKGTERHFFICHRSGSHVARPKIRKRELKSQGSCKLGFHCPAAIDVVDSKNFVTAIYYETHYGHDSDPRHLRLAKTDRQWIAEKLRGGEGVDKVMEDLKQVIKNQKGISRLSLITRHDVHNIQRQCGIPHHDWMHRQEDVSVDLWVQRMQQMENKNPVLLYKKAMGTMDNNPGFSDSDFILVLMTMQQKAIFQKLHSVVSVESIHEPNPQNTHLLAVITVDENGMGYPVAYCLSNRNDRLVVRMFFRALRETCGCLQARILLSGNNAYFLSSWNEVMGSTKHWFLNEHVLISDLKRNLIKVKSGSDKRQEVYARVELVLEERSAEKFQGELRSFVVWLMKDENTRAFGDYFVKHYLPRAEAWGRPFKLKADVHCDSHIELTNVLIRDAYIDGSVLCRMDDCIKQLLKLARDKLFTRFIQLSRKTKESESNKNGQSCHSNEAVMDSSTTENSKTREATEPCVPSNDTVMQDAETAEMSNDDGAKENANRQDCSPGSFSSGVAQVPELSILNEKKSLLQIKNRAVIKDKLQRLMRLNLSCELSDECHQQVVNALDRIHRIYCV